MEIAKSVILDEVWVWSRLTVNQLKSLHLNLYATAYFGKLD